MSNEIYQQKVTAPDGTKLIAKQLWQDTPNVCGGCYFEQESCIDLRLNNSTFECSGYERNDGKSVIWIKLKKEQPVPKHDTIKEIRARSLTLQNEIYKLIEAFEADTGMVVHGADISRNYQLGGKSVLARPELDVRLN